MINFREGDKVRIRKDSIHHNCGAMNPHNDVIGIVVDVYSISEYCINVDWSVNEGGDLVNQYRLNDIELAEKFTMDRVRFV